MLWTAVVFLQDRGRFDRITTILAE